MFTEMSNWQVYVLPFHVDGIIKHILLGFLAPNIIFTGQPDKDIGLCLHVAQYLSLADQQL